MAAGHRVAGQEISLERAAHTAAHHRSRFVSYAMLPERVQEPSTSMFIPALLRSACVIWFNSTWGERAKDALSPQANLLDRFAVKGVPTKTRVGSFAASRWERRFLRPG